MSAFVRAIAGLKLELRQALANALADGRRMLPDHLAYDSLDLFADSAEVTHALIFRHLGCIGSIGNMLQVSITVRPEKPLDLRN